jgi:hypothetical protein
MQHSAIWMTRAQKTLATPFKKSALVLALMGCIPGTYAAGGLDTAGFIENATHNRESYGISKSRTTGQFELSKDLSGKLGSSSMKFNSTFRVTYDAVYDFNDDEWGKNAGGFVTQQGASLPGLGAPGDRIPYGTGLGSPITVLPPGPPGFGLPPTLGFDPALNPNAGLELLGGHLALENGGIGLAVPVRPCDIDPRGCAGLQGYMDLDEDELKWSDFNDRWDFIREFYVQADYDLDNGHQFGVKVGKQQIVWGRTDLFRVLDVLNPVDYSRNNIYDELEDIRIPMWMAEFEYRFGPAGSFDDLNVSFVWNFDKFRPNNLGQAGTPYQALDAGSLFRSLSNCWENGCTVSNFPVPQFDLDNPPYFDPTMPPNLLPVDFGPGIIGIRNTELPNWSLSNSQFGLKVEGVYQDVGFSFNVIEYRSQMPSLRGGIVSGDPFNPVPTEFNDQGQPIAFEGKQGVYPYALAFDIAFPRVTLVGGSLDLYADSIKSAFRVEMAWTDGEEFADTSTPELYTESNVVRWVLGWDRNTFIPFLNKKRAFLLSAQIFGEHLLDHNEITTEVNLPNGDTINGTIGTANWEDNFIFTFLFQGWYMNDRLNPQVIMAHDYEAGHTTIAPAIEYSHDDNWQVTLRANYKLDDGLDKFDDNRTAIPYPGLIAALGMDPSVVQPMASNGTTQSVNPLGRFRTGVLGMAQQEDEIQLTVRYRF